MKNVESFIATLNGLLWDWGSEAPAEAVWGVNGLLDWVEAEYDVTIENRVNEDPMEIGPTWELVAEELRNIFSPQGETPEDEY